MCLEIFDKTSNRPKLHKQARSSFYTSNNVCLQYDVLRKKALDMGCLRNTFLII